MTNISNRSYLPPMIVKSGLKVAEVTFVAGWQVIGLEAEGATPTVKLEGGDEEFTVILNPYTPIIGSDTLFPGDTVTVHYRALSTGNYTAKIEVEEVGKCHSLLN